MIEKNLYTLCAILSLSCSAYAMEEEIDKDNSSPSISMPGPSSSSPIPDVAPDYEAIHEIFLKGKLIYKPNEGNDIGEIELRIADLANPLEGEFDLSKCGDMGKYLSINTGYRKGLRPENANKTEIWFTPRFLVDRELSTMAENHLLRAIITDGKWDAERAPIGIFWTWGGWKSAKSIGYGSSLTKESTATLGSENLLKKYENSRTRVIMPVKGMDIVLFYSRNFTFRL